MAVIYSRTTSGMHATPRGSASCRSPGRPFAGEMRVGLRLDTTLEETRMATTTATVWAARLLSALASAFLVFDALASHTLFPIYVGVLVWGGLYGRDARLRALVPWRTPA
jgi:hypothetical protein